MSEPSDRYLPEQSGQESEVGERPSYQPELPGIHSIHWRGPLPTPSDLAGYDQVVPGAAEKIIESWLEESHSRRQLQEHVARTGIRLALRGQWIAASLAPLAFLIGLVVTLLGLTASAKSPWAPPLLVSPPCS